MAPRPGFEPGSRARQARIIAGLYYRGSSLEVLLQGLKSLNWIIYKIIIVFKYVVLLVLELGCRVAVVADWDIDGVVSAAQIVYSQEVVGRYPLDCRHEVCLIPSTSKTLSHILAEVNKLNISHIVLLDIAYSKDAEFFLKRIRELSIYSIYIDHHISSIIHSHAVEKLVDEFIVGKIPTAYLVFQLMNSLKIALTTRIRAFIEAASTIEGRRHGVINKKFIQLVIALSRTLAYTKDRERWEKLVRWLSSPLPHTSIPFVVDINKFMEPQLNGRDVNIFAKELALRAEKIFNIRFIDARREKIVCRPSAIASALYRIFRNPVILLLTNKGGRNYILIKSRDLTAYTIALELYRSGLAVDIMGHQTLSYSLLREDIDINNIKSIIRNIILKKL